jgi:hypothetical protein
MAGAGAKKRAEDNARTLQRLSIFIVVCAGVHAAVRLWLKASTATWSSWAGLAGTVLVQGFCYLSIAAVARPVYTNGVLVDGGADLSKGAISYYFDVLYVTGFVQVLASFTFYGWYLYLVVPIYGGYMLTTKVIMPMFAKQKEVEVDPATLKKLEKAEKRSERRRVKRF